MRPTAPYKGPVVGRIKWGNLFLARGGYLRNGVLLAPKGGNWWGDLVLSFLEGVSEEGDGGNSTIGIIS